MIMNEVRAVDQRNLSLGNDKSETLHGSGHGSSVGTIIEPMALHITQDPTVFEGKTPCLTQGNPKTGQATEGKDRQPDLQMAERPGERLSQI